MRQRIRTAGGASERTNDIDIRAEEINARLDELDRHVRAPRKPEPPPIELEQDDKTWPVFAVFGAGALLGAMAMLVGFFLAGWPFGSPEPDAQVVETVDELTKEEMQLASAAHHAVIRAKINEIVNSFDHGIEYRAFDEYVRHRLSGAGTRSTIFDLQDAALRSCKPYSNYGKGERALTMLEPLLQLIEPRQFPEDY